jgi:hypothetical protein
MEDGSRNENHAGVEVAEKHKKTLKQQERKKNNDQKGEKQIIKKKKKHPERRKEPTPAAAATTTTTGGQWTAPQRAGVDTRVNRRQKYNSKCNTAKKTSE